MSATELETMPKVHAFRVALYNGPLPFADGRGGADRPFADVYLAPAAVNTGRAMCAFPGGAYRFLSTLSGADYGAYFAARGVSVLSVNFRLGSQGHDGRAMCADALAAVDLARRHATSWGFSADRLGIVGTSAGGHLSGMLSTGAAQRLLATLDLPSSTSLPLAWRPEFAIFCYAVLSLEPDLRHLETAQYFLGRDVHDPDAQRACSPIRNVDPHHCRSFLWHTAEDTEVAIGNTLEMYTRLVGAGVPAELHLYQKGPHALGLARDVKHGAVLHWAEDAVRWIKDDPVEPLAPPPL